jgi:hypothetical protein
LVVLSLSTVAAIATGWLTQPVPLLSSERTEQTIAGSAGAASKVTRESAFTGSEGDEADAGPDMSIAGSAGAASKVTRESA